MFDVPSSAVGWLRVATFVSWKGFKHMWKRLSSDIDKKKDLNNEDVLDANFSNLFLQRGAG